MTKEDMGLDEDDEEGNEDERGEDEGDEQNQDGAENAILKPFGCSRCGRHFREVSVSPVSGRSVTVINICCFW